MNDESTIVIKLYSVAMHYEVLMTQGMTMFCNRNEAGVNAHDVLMPELPGEALIFQGRP